MDRFTRNYSIGLIIIAVIALISYCSNRDPRVDDINRALASDDMLAKYPYQFEVLAIDNDIAIMKSPRSADVPVMRFLRTAFPELNGLSVDDPAMMAAQNVLVTHQSHAAELVSQQPDIRGVRWEFDRQWFQQRGAFIAE